MGGAATGAPESDALAARPREGTSRHGDVFNDTKAPPAWFLPFLKRIFGSAGRGQVVKWLELATQRMALLTKPVNYLNVTL